MQVLQKKVQNRYQTKLHSTKDRVHRSDKANGYQANETVVQTITSPYHTDIVEHQRGNKAEEDIKPTCILSMKTVDERVSSSTVDRRGEVGGSTKGSDSSSSAEDSASDGCVSENLEVRYGLLLSAKGSSPAEDCASTVWLEENEVSRAPFWYTDPSTDDCVLDPWVTEDGRSWVSALAQKGSQETVVVAVDNLVGVVEMLEGSNSFTDGS